MCIMRGLECNVIIEGRESWFPLPTQMGSHVLRFKAPREAKNWAMMQVFEASIIESNRMFIRGLKVYRVG